MKELIVLSALGILSLVAEILQFKRIILPMVIAGLMLNIGLCVYDFGNNEQVFGMLVLDRVPLAFTILFSFVAIVWLLMNRAFLTADEHTSDYLSLVMFSLVGVFLLTTYTHMTMLFLGVEILSIPVYVLVGSDRYNVKSNEAAFKYFLMGAFASGFLLLGITFVYGALGSFNVLQLISSSISQFGISQQLLVIGLLLILFAMSFKMSAAPFHFWTPDVYDGAPTPITAYMSTIVKIGAVAGFFRLFSLVIAYLNYYEIVMLIIAVLTIVLGNVIAATQSNVKRLLAYSSIGHAGFMILGIATLQPSHAMATGTIIWYYLAAYCFASLAAFWILMLVVKGKEDNDIDRFNGLFKKQPVLAVVMTVALLSLAGIPPLSGFFAKYFILTNVLFKNAIIIAVIAILASLVGAYYYFRIIIAMFTATPLDTDEIAVSSTDKTLLILLAVLLFALGVAPDIIFQFVLTT